MKYIKLFESFEGQSFLSWLENNIDQDGKQDRKFKRDDEEWKNLDNINLQLLDLTDLIGIGNLSSLEFLWCHNNKITSLEGIENLKKLKYLDFSNNKVKSLKWVEDLTNLENLYFHSNKVSSLIELKKLINLRQINCSDNLLQNLDGINGLTNLYHLNCGENRLKNIDEIKNSFNLEFLNCCNNKLKSLEFSNFSIEAFEIGVDETDIKRFKELETLFCKDNEFSINYKKYIKEYCNKKGISAKI